MTLARLLARRRRPVFTLTCVVAKVDRTEISPVLVRSFRDRDLYRLQFRAWRWLARLRSPDGLVVQLASQEAKKQFWWLLEPMFQDESLVQWIAENYQSSMLQWPNQPKGRR